LGVNGVFRAGYTEETKHKMKIQQLKKYKTFNANKKSRAQQQQQQHICGGCHLIF
jgi:predicted  nucleic acid-binding Zn-ribbon protein